MSSACKPRAGRHQPADVVLNGRRHSATNPQPARAATVEVHAAGYVMWVWSSRSSSSYNVSSIEAGAKKMEEDIKDGPYECFDA